MDICAVICEFNPFHNGHAYILDQARKHSGCDAVLALMSGNFVQRGMPAIVDEYTRAKCALLNGADVVLELPAIYATAMSASFAQGAINILNTIPGVTTLAMGAENDNADLLLLTAKIQAEESLSFKRYMKDKLDSGESYPRAYTYATAREAEKYGADFNDVYRLLNKPNNILASAYAKSLILTNSEIRFLPIKRIGGDISDEFKGTFSSASAIRLNLHDAKIALAMPENSYALTCERLSSHPLKTNEYECLALHSLRTALPKDISDTPECTENFELRIKKIAEKVTDFSEFMNKIGTSRFTKGRIQRIVLHTLLGIKRQMLTADYKVSRLLGIKTSAVRLLSEMPKNIIKSKADEKHIPPQLLPIYGIDKAACSVYSLITHSNDCQFYKKLLQV